jgi:FkbM family methyltransferase
MRPDRNRARPRAPLRGEKRIFPAPAAEGPPPEDRDARTAYFDQARYRAEYLGVATDEGEFVVSTSDRHLGKALFVKRSRPEFRVLRLATSVVRSALGVDALAGRTFVDVGANIGTTTVCALRSHGFGAAVCCEAEPANHRLLETNLALNGLKDRAQTRRVGVSSQCGRAKLVVHEESGVFSWVAVDEERIRVAEASRRTLADELMVEAPPTTSVVDIDLITLDQLAEDGVIDRDLVGMIWIDVEGHEGHVLKGAATLVERGVPLVLEVDPTGLEARGDPRMLYAVAERSYTHFVDVRRRKGRQGGAGAGLQPLAALGDHAARFRDPDGPSHTDLLLLRLDAAQARAAADPAP